MVVAAEGADVAALVAGHDHFRPPLYVLDVVAGPLWRNFSSDTLERLRQLKKSCTAPGVGVFAPAALIPLFERADLIVRAPPDWFDAEASLALAAGMVGKGLVKFCAPVADKMTSQTIGAALTFKAGDAVETALRAAFIQAICLKFDMRLTSRPRQAS